MLSIGMNGFISMQKMQKCEWVDQCPERTVLFYCDSHMEMLSAVHYNFRQWVFKTTLHAYLRYFLCHVKMWRKAPQLLQCCGTRHSD